MAEKRKLNTLSSSTLKLMACAFMLVDHVGVRLFPAVLGMRLIGRLAFPIFAFFIGEGCRYTKNRLKHFLSVFVLGIICESVYIIYMGYWYGNILLTFSVSIVLIYIMQWSRQVNKPQAYIITAAAVLAVYTLTNYVNFDYGFTGIIAPMFAAWPGDRFAETAGIKPAPPKGISKLLIFAFGIMLTTIGNPLGMYQLFALLSVILLTLYSGRPGSRKLKYFFYIFYPVHLLLIELAAMLI